MIGLLLLPEHCSVWCTQFWYSGHFVSLVLLCQSHTLHCIRSLWAVAHVESSSYSARVKSKVNGKFFSLSLSWRHIGGEEVWVHLFLTLALNGDELTLCPSCFTLRIEPWYPVGPQSQSGCSWRRKHLLSLPGFEHWTIQSTALVATMTTLLWLSLKGLGLLKKCPQDSYLWHTGNMYHWKWTKCLLSENIFQNSFILYHVVVTGQSNISGFPLLGIWFFLDILNLEDETIIFSQNAGNQIPNDTVSELIRVFASATAWQELKKNFNLRIEPIHIH